MQREKFKILLYLKKSGLDKLGQAPIMGRITYGRTIAQFSCKLSCAPDLWNARESRFPQSCFGARNFHVPPICGTLVRAD